MDQNERRAWGPLIREARQAQNIGQQELADMTGVSRRTIGSIERGDSVAQTKVLERILVVLGLVDATKLDDDVTAFLAIVGPLLQRMDQSHRVRVMPPIVELLADELRTGGARSNVLPFRGLSAHRPTVTEADLIGKPSVAEPIRDDIEGDEDPEDP